MGRLAGLGAVTAMAALLIGCVPVDPAPTSTTSAPPTTVDVECQIEVGTIETALAAHEVENGHYPDSLLDLVGVWTEAPPIFEWAYSSDGAAYTLTGPC